MPREKKRKTKIKGKYTKGKGKVQDSRLTVGAAPLCGASG